jgi:hypothetical protein
MKRIAFAGCAALAVLVLGQARPVAQTAKFKFVTAIYADDKGVGFSVPEGVACGAGGRVIVGDTGNDRLVGFTYQDKAVSGGTPLQAPQAAAPARVYLNSKGDIYVLNNKERRVVHLSSEGEYKNALTFEGAPAPSNIVARGFAIDSADNVYVSDVFSARVLVANAQDKFQRVLPFPADFGYGSELAVDEAGNLLFLDSIKRRLFSAAKDATSFAAVGGDLGDAIGTIPAFMTVNKGTLFIVEGSGSRIVTLRRDGTFIARQLGGGREEGLLDHPSQLCVNDKDEVFVADRDNSRIQVFQLIR